MGGGGSKRNFEIKSGEIAGVTRSPEGGHTPKIIFVGHYVTKIGKLGGGSYHYTCAHFYVFGVP